MTSIRSPARASKPIERQAPDETHNPIHMAEAEPSKPPQSDAVQHDAGTLPDHVPDPVLISVSPQQDVLVDSLGNEYFQVLPQPVLIYDYQLANTHAFNFATKKLRTGVKTVVLPAHELQQEITRRNPDRTRAKALRDELLPHAVRIFKEWDSRQPELAELNSLQKRVR